MGMVMKSGSGGGVGGGEIVQVQGGHIVRSTGRKDRHSKVYTAKGPRDRRVRLSAHTAIQFYDVQDRLGYDRPSKAVDWLIKKAKSSIDKLAELPAWHPPMAEANEMVIAGDGAEETESSGYNFHQLQNQTDSSNFNIAASLDSDAIADTMKSFFPTSSAAANSSINFQNYPPHDDLISNPTTTQDLGLSLHSFQDVQGLNIHHHNHHQSQGGDQIQTLFGTTVGFDRSSYQRMVAWSNENRGGGGSGGGGFLFNSQQDELPPHNHHQQHESFGQGGTLQSSFEPSVSARGWNDHLQMTSQRSQQQPLPLIHQSSSIFGTRFGGSDGGGGGGLPTFCLPGRMQQGQEAENGLVSDQPSSTSSHNSTHR